MTFYFQEKSVASLDESEKLETILSPGIRAEESSASIRETPCARFLNYNRPPSGRSRNLCFSIIVARMSPNIGAAVEPAVDTLKGLLFYLLSM